MEVDFDKRKINSGVVQMEFKKLLVYANEWHPADVERLEQPDVFQVYVDMKLGSDSLFKFLSDKANGVPTPDSELQELERRVIRTIAKKSLNDRIAYADQHHPREVERLKQPGVLKVYEGILTEDCLMEFLAKEAGVSTLDDQPEDIENRVVALQFRSDAVPRDAWDLLYPNGQHWSKKRGRKPERHSLRWQAFEKHAVSEIEYSHALAKYVKDKPLDDDLREELGDIIFESAKDVKGKTLNAIVSDMATRDP